MNLRIGNDDATGRTDEGAAAADDVPVVATEDVTAIGRCIAVAAAGDESFVTATTTVEGAPTGAALCTAGDIGPLVGAATPTCAD